MAPDRPIQSSEYGVPKERRIAKVRAVAATPGLCLAVKGAPVPAVHVMARRRQVEERDEADMVLGRESLL